MTGLGIPQTDICLMVRGPKGKPISLTTLEKHFRKEIDTGATNLRTRVGNFMISVIMGSDPPPGFKPFTDEKVRGSLLELFAAAQLNWRKTVRQARQRRRQAVHLCREQDRCKTVGSAVPAV